MTEDVMMGKNSYTISSSLMINGESVTLPAIALTIYNAKLVLTSSATNNEVDYYGSTTISISTNSQNSLNDVFGNNITPSYV